MMTKLYVTEETTCFDGTSLKNYPSGSNGVKIGINRTVRINCIAGKCHLPYPNGHHHESFINVFSGFSTI